MVAATDAIGITNATNAIAAVQHSRIVQCKAVQEEVALHKVVAAINAAIINAAVVADLVKS